MRDDTPQAHLDNPRLRFGKMPFLDTPLMNVIMYLFLAWAVCYIAWWEQRDCVCPNSPWDDDALCGEYNGMYIAGTTATTTDSTADIIEKTIEAAKGESKTIKWRRAFILSAIIMLGVSVFVYQRILDWKQYYLMCLISFAILYFSLNFYSYHVNQKATDVVAKNMKLLMDRLGTSPKAASDPKADERVEKVL